MKIKRFAKDINPDNGRFELPFLYQGVVRTLIKRDQVADAAWQLRKTHKCKPCWRSTGTPDAELAVNKAKTLLDAIMAEDSHALQSSKLRDPLRYSTLNDVFDVYEAKAAIRRRTINNNIGALKSICWKARGQGLSADELTTADLTGRLIRDYQGKAIEAVRGQKLAANAERAAMARAQRTADSTWMQARSIFSAAMMGRYRDAGLVFPSNFEADFCKAPKILLKTERRRYVQPADDIILETMASARQMMAQVRQAQPPVDGNGLAGRAMNDDSRAQRAARLELDKADRMVIVFALEIGCGLRKGELVAARGGWIGRVNEQLSVTLPEDITKNGLPRRLQLPGEFGDYITEYLQRRKLGAEDPLVRNAERVTKEVSAWLRKLGWNGTKTNHALRKYFGYLVAKEFGIAAAQWALDHSDLDTVQIYTGIIKGDGLVVKLPAAAADPKVIAMRKVA